MTTTIDPSRQFQLWEYHVSHGKALIRSPKTAQLSTNIDVLLFGVEYIALPRLIGTLRIEDATDAEIEEVQSRIGRTVERQRVVVFASGSLRHLAVAAKLVVRESTMDIFESAFVKP